MIKTYHIIGGGLAGLNSARFIKQKNPKSKTVIYEMAPQCGGRCYSFYDKQLQTNIDNATHVILGANSEALRFAGKEFETPYFVDFKTKEISSSALKNKKEIALAVFNTELEKAPFSMIKTVACKLFPFFGKKTKAYFSHNDLSEKLISPLLKYTDDLKLNYKLKSFEESNGKIDKLIFNKEEVVLGKNDIVVSAMDAHNYHKIFGGPEFEFNSIINIFYRTSMKITLPKNLSFIGVKNAISQWIFANKDTLSVTISDAENIKMSDEELAVAVWKEICELRGREAARLPAYQIIKNKRATIKQDKKNNDLRPTSHKTKYSNLFVTGDWSMKDFPCCIEGAILSSKRLSTLR